VCLRLYENLDTFVSITQYSENDTQLSLDVSITSSFSEKKREKKEKVGWVNVI
jgi:hypothetical protein